MTVYTRKSFFLLLSIVGFIFASCTNSYQKKPSNAFLGGEIVNPEQDYVVLQRNSFTDTAYLNQYNRFQIEISKAEKGLYVFEHNYEKQMLYLNPGDSIMVRVNTLEFDESLHFSGPGSRKNNWLIHVVVEDKRNNALLLSYNKLEPPVFIEKTDSIKKKRLESLQNLNEKFGFSDDFINLAQHIIQYENYDLNERYIFLLNKYSRFFEKQLPKDFYAYRKNVNFNDKKLQQLPVYQRFLESYLVNRSIAHCLKEFPNQSSCYELDGIVNIITQINLVESLTNLTEIKQIFYEKLGVSFMIMGRNRGELSAVLKLLQEKGINKKSYEMLKQLSMVQSAFFPGTSVNNVPLLNAFGEEITFEEISKKPKIAFFWSLFSPAHHRRQHKIIEELREKYPDIDFTGINIDLGKTVPWQKTLAIYHYDSSMEFQLNAQKMSIRSLDSNLPKYYLNKLLFIDASGTVMNGNIYIYSPDFESKILEFINR